jgi:hypothetical protein
MWNKLKLIIFYAGVLVIYGISVLVADEQEIEWAPSKIAKSYKIEVRDFSSKKIKLEKKVKQTSYKVDKLEPGLYEYRIGIINDKEVTVIYSEWTTLSVIQAFEPEGSVEEIYYGGKQDKFQEIYITGNNFYEDTKIEIFSEKGKIPVKNLVKVNDRELRFVLDLTNAKPGSYDLKIINPLNKIYVKKGFYLLGQTKAEAEKIIVEAAKKGQGVDTSVDRKYFIQSLLIPGRGQYNSGKDYESRARKIKGGIFFTTTIGLGIFTALSYRDYLNKKHEVDNLNYINNLVNYPYNPSSSIQGLYLSHQFTNGTLQLDNKWHTFTGASLAFAGIYLINLIDAYFFTGPIQNPAAANNYEKNYQFKAYILPDRSSTLNMGTTNIGSSYIFEYSFRF